MLLTLRLMRTKFLRLPPLGIRPVRLAAAAPDPSVAPDPAAAPGLAPAAAAGAGRAAMGACGASEAAPAPSPAWQASRRASSSAFLPEVRLPRCASLHAQTTRITALLLAQQSLQLLDVLPHVHPRACLIPKGLQRGSPQ